MMGAVCGISEDMDRQIVQVGELTTSLLAAPRGTTEVTLANVNASSEALRRRIWVIFFLAEV